MYSYKYSKIIVLKAAGGGVTTQSGCCIISTSVLEMGKP